MVTYGNFDLHRKQIKIQYMDKMGDKYFNVESRFENNFLCINPIGPN